MRDGEPVQARSGPTEKGGGDRRRSIAIAGRLVLAAFLLGDLKGMAQTNAPISLDANGLRDRLYDAAAGAALARYPIQAENIHLFDEMLRKNPGLLSAAEAAQAMQQAINGMANDFGNGPQLTSQDLAGRALPYVRNALGNTLSSDALDAVMTGLSLSVLAEQQGLLCPVYSNLTATPLPAGTLFSDVENTAWSILALYRQADSAVLALGLPERIRTATSQAFREAAGQVVSQLVSISPDDTLETIVQTIPALRNSALVQGLVQGIQTAGQVVTDVNTVMSGLTNVLGSLHQAVNDGADLLGQVANAQSDLLGSLTDPSLLADGLDVAQEVSSFLGDGIDAAQTTLNLASALFKLAGNSKLAQEVATAGGAAIKVAQAVEGISDAVQAADGLFSVAEGFAEGGPIGGLIGAALDVFSVFGSGMFGSGSGSDDGAVLQQINAVRQDIANLRQDMDMNFERVDAALTNVLGKLDYELGLITTDFDYVASNLGQIRADLLDLQGEVQRLETQTYYYLLTAANQDLQLALNGALGFEQNNGIPMDYPTFINYVTTIYTYGHDFSQDAVRQPDLGDYSVAGLYEQLSTHPAMEENLEYIVNFLNATLGVPWPSGGNPVANARLWSVAANAYLQLCLENLVWFHRMSPDNLDGLIAVGNNLNLCVNQLVALSTNAPNTNGWIAVGNGYRSAVTGFTNAVLGALTNFDITYGYPTGFNPFTNLFLSLVTSNSGAITDGYYTNASVASVSAIACSPTPDGMPIYLLDSNVLRRLDSNGMITTVAGSARAGFQDGPSALFNNPRGLAVGLDGSVYVADTGNHAIRVWTTTNGLNTLAGYLAGTNNTVPVAGAVDGAGGAARFNRPRGLLIDGQGNLVVADTGNHAIRLVTPTGVVTTFAGTLGTGGLRDGLTVGAAQASPGENALIAQFWAPTSLAMDTSGLISVINPTTPMIRTIDTNGVVKTCRGAARGPAWLFQQGPGANSTTLPSSALRASIAAPAAGGYYHSVYGFLDFSIAVMSDGTLTAWGENGWGECNVPRGLTNVVAVATGLAHSLALCADGTVVAWGDFDNGGCNVPAGLSNVVALAAGDDHSLALRDDGTVTAWGYNYYGECNVPAGLTNVVALAAGWYHSLALRGDGTVSVWGESSDGECDVPAGLTNAVAVAAGWDFSVALRADGTVTAWGYNGYGECNVPAGLTDVVAVAAAELHCLALRGDGTVTAWGYDGQGQCDVPPGLNNVVAVAAADRYSMALRSDGTMVQWGQIAGNMPATNPPQTLDTLATNAVVQRLTAGVVTPDGRVLVADQYGLRLFDYSDRAQRQAAAFLYNDLTGAAGAFSQAGNALKAWRLLLQNLSTFAVSDALATDDVLHSLLFGADGLPDGDYAATFLGNLVTKADWRPTHVDLGGLALQRIDVLQSRILEAVVTAATNANPADLQLVLDTLGRLNLLRATYDQPIPPAALSVGLGSNGTVQVGINGCPYLDYIVLSSSDGHSWPTNSAVVRDGDVISDRITSAPAKFYRLMQAR